ncbi:hypothetical protein GCK72_002895 [Caenorhabditis remanei]|uniref:Uncharacterized protein n=1 Tax=Caenorhabditis remanei TaxID=31234 RepID=A0A6A5HSA4_CAERE|nr:hypothetical protein GCK72_002895 [Caenorhabditis remanei]KAF1771070.1 hypothetical protein GCK72_002895 [Caenorhabditis remanei]
MEDSIKNSIDNRELARGDILFDVTLVPEWNVLSDGLPLAEVDGHEEGATNLRFLSQEVDNDEVENEVGEDEVSEGTFGGDGGELGTILLVYLHSEAR